MTTSLSRSYVCVTSKGVFGPFVSPDVAHAWFRDNYPHDDDRALYGSAYGVYELQSPPHCPDICIAGANLRAAAQRVVSSGDPSLTQADDGQYYARVDGRAFAWLESAVRSDA